MQGQKTMLCEGEKRQRVRVWHPDLQHEGLQLYGRVLRWRLSILQAPHGCHKGQRISAVRLRQVEMETDRETEEEI